MADQFLVAGKCLPQASVLLQGGCNATHRFDQTTIGNGRGKQVIRVKTPGACRAVACAKLLWINPSRMQIGEIAPHG
jgi:hypothetical protein